MYKSITTDLFIGYYRLYIPAMSELETISNIGTANNDDLLFLDNGTSIYEDTNTECAGEDANDKLDVVRKADKQFYKLKRRRRFGRGTKESPYYFKKWNVRAYGSGQTGTYIRNAISGLISNCVIGSRDEYLFYRVSISTGEGRNRQPIFLYYDSPAEYEKHFLTKVSPEIREEWEQRFTAYCEEKRIRRE